jgi:hypothetical protein
MDLPDADGSLPEHLLVCSSCLEAYELIRAGLPEPSPRSVERFVRETTESRRTAVKVAPSIPSPKTIRTRFGTIQWLATAAVLVGIAIAAFLFFHVPPGTRLTINTGTLHGENGKRLETASVLIDGAWMKASDGAEIVLADRFHMTLGRWTSVRIEGTEAKGTLNLRLRNGSVAVHPPRQSASCKLKIETPWGTVIPQDAAVSIISLYPGEAEKGDQLQKGAGDAEFKMDSSGILIIVEKGTAELETPDGTREIRQGEQARLGEPETIRPGKQ